MRPCIRCPWSTHCAHEPTTSVNRLAATSLTKSKASYHNALPSVEYRLSGEVVGLAAQSPGLASPTHTATRRASLLHLGLCTCPQRSVPDRTAAVAFGAHAAERLVFSAPWPAP
jgi:hypothetical protein